MFLRRATEGTAPSPTEGSLVQTPKQNIKSRVRIPWMHLFTLIQLLSLQHSVPLAGLLWLSKIRLHCPPHLTMGIHCFYTARLSTDSFICGVDQLSFCGGAQREQHPRLQRGRYNTPAYRYPPQSVYIAPHGHQNNRSYHSSSMFLRVMGPLASLRNTTSWGFNSQKHLSTRNPQK